MAQNSKIEWTNHTANLWWGCTKVHEGCDNCYAETLSKRWDFDVWGNDKSRRAIKSVRADLNRFQKMAKQDNQMHRVFVGSMMDIFEKPMPVVDAKGNKIPLDDMDEVGMNTNDIRASFFNAIDRGEYPNLMFLLLTKRPSNINKYIPESWKENPPSNVMFGTSPVNQETFTTLTRHLSEVNGKKFLSIEPQLDWVNIDGVKVDWIIQGGESGHHKRPFDLQWAYAMRNQCESLGIPYFFKQIDKIQTIPTDLMIRQFPA